MDNDIKEYWDFYITQRLRPYMEKRYKNNNEKDKN